MYIKTNTSIVNGKCILTLFFQSNFCHQSFREEYMVWYTYQNIELPDHHLLFPLNTIANHFYHKIIKKHRFMRKWIGESFPRLFQLYEIIPLYYYSICEETLFLSFGQVCITCQTNVTICFSVSQQLSLSKDVEKFGDF